MSTAVTLLATGDALLSSKHVPGDWESEPQYKDELESVVEREPVNGADETLKDSEESENDPVLISFVSRAYVG